MIARWLTALACALTVSAGMVAAAPAALAAETIDVSVAPDPPHVDESVVITATVTGGTPASLQVTRTDRDGQRTPFMATPTGTPGVYAGNDPLPAVQGTITYDVTDPADSTSTPGHASVHVQGLPTSLSIKASRSIVLFRHSVGLTAHLGTTFTNRSVSIYARPYDGVRTRIATGDVNATSGNLSATYTMHRRTRFIAEFAGDDKYAPASVYVIVRARAVLTERLRGYYSTSGAYRLYHPGDNPELDARLWPHQHRVCLYFRAQYRSGGSWHNASLSPCVRTDSEARAAAVLHNALSLPYRLRAEWRGNALAVANHGPWQHLRFR